MCSVPILKNAPTLPDTIAKIYQNRLTAENRATCRQCGQKLRDERSLHRHVANIHRRPARGENPKAGYYRCKCGTHWNYSRKSSYRMHFRSCREEQRTMHSYYCQCGRGDVNFEQHEIHYRSCAKNVRPVGRPRAVR